MTTGSWVNKAVLSYLASLCDDAWECWPSLDTIADETEMSRRGVIYAVNALEAAGLINRSARARSGGGRSSNLYHLNPDAKSAASGDGKRARAALLGQATVHQVPVWGKGAQGAPPTVHADGGKGARGAPESSRTNKNITFSEIPTREEQQEEESRRRREAVDRILRATRLKLTDHRS